MVSHLEGPVSNLYPLNIFFIGQLITGKGKRGREPGGLYFICLIEGLLWGSQSLLIIYLREVVYFILFCFIIFYDTGGFLENRTLQKRLWQGHLKRGVRAFASMEGSQDTLGTCIFLSPWSAPLFGTRFPPWIIFIFHLLSLHLLPPTSSSADCPWHKLQFNCFFKWGKITRSQHLSLSTSLLQGKADIQRQEELFWPCLGPRKGWRKPRWWWTSNIKEIKSWEWESLSLALLGSQKSQLRLSS